MKTRVFVSYHSGDRALAQAICDSLTHAGFTVWFDRQLTAGAEYRQEIDAELRAADIVLALWTPGAVASSWVKAEAQSAYRRGRLISVEVDAARAPRAFTATVTAHLRTTEGETNVAEVERALKRAMGAALGYERVYSVGEILPHRGPDIALTFFCAWAVWTGLIYLLLHTPSNNYSVMDGDIYLHVGNELIKMPNVVIVASGLWATSFFAPFAFLGASAVDFIGRRAFKLSISPSKRRLALRWLGEGIGAAAPLVALMWIYPTTTRQEQFDAGVSGITTFVVGIPIVVSVFFALILIPKYIPLFLNLRLRRACVP